jgi:hypothetical protein
MKSKKRLTVRLVITNETTTNDGPLLILKCTGLSGPPSSAKGSVYVPAKSYYPDITAKRFDSRFSSFLSFLFAVIGPIKKKKVRRAKLVIADDIAVTFLFDPP